MTPEILEALHTAWTERPDNTFVRILLPLAPMTHDMTDTEVLARLHNAYPPGSPEARLAAIRALCDLADGLKPWEFEGRVRAVLDGAS